VLRAPRTRGLTHRRMPCTRSQGTATASRWIIDDAQFARADAVPAVLRERAPVVGGWVRRVGEGEVFGAVLDVFGLRGGAGCVCDVTVCAAEALLTLVASPHPRFRVGACWRMTAGR
jgi:hypothetical protein